MPPLPYASAVGEAPPAEGSRRGTVAQYVGRFHRLHEGKREVQVYDYADIDVPMLARTLEKRRRAYEAQVYVVERPASGTPFLSTYIRVKILFYISF